MTVDHYYEARRAYGDRWRAYVYHYDASGNRELVDFMSQTFDTEDEATTAALDWCEANGIEAKLA